MNTTISFSQVCSAMCSKSQTARRLTIQYVRTIELQYISVTAELTCTVTIKEPAGRVARSTDRVTKRRGACANRSTGADGETATGASASGRRWRRWRGSEYMIEGERASEGDR